MRATNLAAFLFAVACPTACRRAPTTIERDPAGDAALPPPPPPAPVASAIVEVRVHAEAARMFAIEIGNTGKAETSIGGRLDVEVLGDAGWTRALAEGRTLDLDCSHDACSTLAVGATIRSPPWEANVNGCLQDDCFCKKGPCVVDCIVLPAAAGRYRIVARSCDGKSRWDSEPFEVPPR